MILFVFVAAALAALLVTPAVVRVVTARGVYGHVRGTVDPEAPRVPRMGGIAVCLATTIALALAAALFGVMEGTPGHGFLAGVLLAGWIIFIAGLADDLFDLRPTTKLLAQCLAAVVAYAFGFRIVEIAFAGVTVQVGLVSLALTVLWIVAVVNAFNLIDGLDGLAGGLATSAFTAYAVIAFMQGRYGVAAFCMTIVGGLLSYTWFNIFPARFFMGDIGSFSLGTALGVVAMITDTVLLLPIIAAVFVAEAGSTLIQILSKKLRGGKKIFKIAPVHHHFEASGWEETKVTMRFWVIGQVAGVVGLMLFLLGGGL